MNIAFLNELRRREMKDILARHKKRIEGKRVLEIGGGTGEQAKMLAAIAEKVVSLELAESNYRADANHFIALYDGHHIPFPDASFDVVYSSNVLEHIGHRDAFQEELLRVLKPGGYAIHSMPTHWWKLRDLLENLLLFPAIAVLACIKSFRGESLGSGGLFNLMLGRRHGEFGNTLTEVWHFMPRVWLQHFKRLHWHVVETYGGGLFYTGWLWCAGKLSWRARRRLARLFGSSIHIYVLQKSYT